MDLVEMKVVVEEGVVKQSVVVVAVVLMYLDLAFCQEYVVDGEAQLLDEWVVGVEVSCQKT